MSKSSKLSRRDFLQTTAKVGALGRRGALFVPAAALGLSGKPGANSRIHLGLIGAGGMGRHNLENCAKHDNVAVTAVCEVAQDRLDMTVAKYKPSTSPTMTTAICCGRRTSTR